MDKNNYIDLVKARIERVKELLEDVEMLLERGFYEIVFKGGCCTWMLM